MRKFKRYAVVTSVWSYVTLLVVIVCIFAYAYYINW